jgi:hypothetical protein
MLESRTKNLHLVKILIISIFITLIALFALFRSLNYIKGPEISILSPNNGSIIESNFTKISGNAKRIVKITINGFPISIDEQGNWQETLIIYNGINQISIEAEDQFGRSVKKQLDIVGKTNQ